MQFFNYNFLSQELIFLVSVISVVLLIEVYFYFLRKRENPKVTLSSSSNPGLSFEETNAIIKRLDEIPSVMLRTIQGSINSKKGALGELVGLTQLKAEYDRVIPLGNIVDFIGIKFASEHSPGCIDFIDIKSNKARLSKQQKQLQNVIISKNINFIKVKIDIDRVS